MDKYDDSLTWEENLKRMRLMEHPSDFAPNRPADLKRPALIQPPAPPKKDSGLDAEAYWGWKPGKYHGMKDGLPGKGLTHHEVGANGDYHIINVRGSDKGIDPTPGEFYAYEGMGGKAGHIPNYANGPLAGPFKTVDELKKRAFPHPDEDDDDVAAMFSSSDEPEAEPAPPQPPSDEQLPGPHPHDTSPRQIPKFPPPEKWTEGVMSEAVYTNDELPVEDQRTVREQKLREDLSCPPLPLSEADERGYYRGFHDMDPDYEERGPEEDDSEEDDEEGGEDDYSVNFKRGYKHGYSGEPREGGGDRYYGAGHAEGEGDKKGGKGPRWKPDPTPFDDLEEAEGSEPEAFGNPNADYREGWGHGHAGKPKEEGRTPHYEAGHEHGTSMRSLDEADEDEVDYSGGVGDDGSSEVNIGGRARMDSDTPTEVVRPKSRRPKPGSNNPFGQDMETNAGVY